MKKFFLFFKFSKWAWVTTIIYLPILLTTINFMCYFGTQQAFALFAFLLALETAAASYFYVIVFRGLNERFRDYYRLHKIMEEQVAKGKPIKKVILYQYSETLCGAEVTKQLCKDFNLKLDWKVS